MQPKKGNTNNSKKKYKGKKRTDRDINDDKNVDVVRKGQNDVSWYGSEEMISAAAKINFTTPLGKPLGWEYYKEPESDVTMAMEIPPVSGIMTFGVALLPGVCEASSDALNIFVRNFYSWIRHQNSGHANYDAPDMGQYLLAVDGIHAMLEHLIKVYGVARIASVTNRYLPNALLTAMGVAPDDTLFNNLADIRARILQLMVKAGTLCVPKDIKYNERHRDLFKYVYADGEVTKSQLYTFYPAYYHIYDEAEARLVAHESPKGQGIYEWLSTVSSMLDAVIESESFNIMSGDILKAYSADGVYHMDYFGEDYTVLPVYNPEMLMQIHNLKITGMAYEDGALDIYQDPNRTHLKCIPYFKQSFAVGGLSPILDVPVEDPTPKQVMIATRLTNVGVCGNPDNLTYCKYVPNTMGAEAIVHAEVLTINDSGTVETMTWNSYVQAGNPIYGILTRTAPFDWCPHMYLFTNTGTGINTQHFVGLHSELQNYTIVTRQDLSKINEVALLGLLRVPLMGTWETNFGR